MDKERVRLNSSYSIDIPMTTPPKECKSQESSTEKAEEDEQEAATEEQPTQVVTIQADNGKSCVMKVRPTDEVSGLMHKIHRWSGVAPVNHKLLYEGYHLDMEMECINNKTKLLLRQAKHGGGCCIKVAQQRNEER